MFRELKKHTKRETPMSIRESYPTNNPLPTVFTFLSIGKKGVIPKVIIYEYIKDNRYNLAFGDFIDGEVNDGIISNNNDLIKVISTVAETIYLFTEKNPDIIIEIKGVDKKRTQLYNSLFQRRIEEINANFIVDGIKKNGEREPYDVKQTYHGFEIQRKK